MDTQDFVEAVKMWVEIYRENRLPGLEYPPAKDPEIIKWEKNMLRIAAVISPPEALHGTPAYPKIQEAVRAASTGNQSCLKEVYENLSQVDEYLKENIA